MAAAIDQNSILNVGGTAYEYHRLDAVAEGHVARLPFSLKILLENLLRHRGAGDVREADISALANWDPRAEPRHEIAFTPARVILQDFTGVPAVVDLAAMREAIVKLGGRPETINPLSPAELVIDHSVQVDHYGSRDSLAQNIAVEFQRNMERYSFLRWGQNAFRNFKVVPPNTGIVHQVNIEHLARVVFDVTREGRQLAYPDTLVGTDSHTTMVNALGVLGWGVGGIEAEAAMLGQPVTMLIPQVLGVKLSGSLREGTTATDLVLTLTEQLRKKGVVNKFVEFFGDGLGSLPLADRATLANMSPEFGSTCAIFPIDRETIRYLKLTGRDARHVALVEAYARAQGLWREDGQPDALYTDVLELDLGSIEPTLAGPRRPQDRLPLATVASAYRQQVVDIAGKREGPGKASVTRHGKSFEVADGAVLIAAITSCTNTSNPSVMVAAGLLARNAHRRGLAAKPWVKTSLAPGSRVVTNYLERAGLLPDLEALGFDVVGYGCTTCIGNSGPLDDDIAAAVKASRLVGCAVLSGNRNFEGRIHPQVRMNYLASPPLVVAYALAGSMNVDLTSEPLGTGADGKPVFLRDIWPSQHEIAETVSGSVDSRMFQSSYAGVFAGDANWQKVPTPSGDLYAWDAGSTYVQHPPYFTDMSRKPQAVGDIRGARALAVLGDSVTTDHISPAGSIAVDSPAGRYLVEHGVRPTDFNSYGARRGNHEVMMRGTFANIRLRNMLVPGVEGGVTLHLPDNAQMSIYDASMRYQGEGVPLVILAGKEYGSGSSRDWAAKGTMLLGVKAVIAESYERIHRSNLIGMGILPLQFVNGQNAQALGLSGRERFDIEGLDGGTAQDVTVTATGDDGKVTRFKAQVRIDTPKERAYYAHGGILHYVLRQIADSTPAA
ncbi:MAG: aconitate hydratase AcnA [Gammaproteobacteria bacterium]|nr:MAG: aconitate hydratase AcnA [Gammaproteobacteria bacterium]